MLFKQSFSFQSDLKKIQDNSKAYQSLNQWSQHWTQLSYHNFFYRKRIEYKKRNQADIVLIYFFPKVRY